jgi:hypothetical protein
MQVSAIYYAEKEKKFIYLRIRCTPLPNNDKKGTLPTHTSIFSGAHACC